MAADETVLALWPGGYLRRCALIGCASAAVRSLQASGYYYAEYRSLTAAGGRATTGLKPTLFILELSCRSGLSNSASILAAGLVGRGIVGIDRERTAYRIRLRMQRGDMDFAGRWCVTATRLRRRTLFAL